MPITRLPLIIAVAGLLAGGRASAQPFTPPPPPSADVLWRVAGEARGSPVHDDERVYFLTKDRAVVALDTATGEQRWRTATGVSSEDGIFGATTAGIALAIDGPMVIGGDWDVVAFDRTNGARQWTYTAPDGDGPGLFLGQAADGVVYAGSVLGRVYGIDTTSGRQRWMTTVADGKVTVFEPIVDGDAVFVGFTEFSRPSTGGMAMLDARTGRLRWKAAFPSSHDGPQELDRGGGPVVVDDLVFGSAIDGHIYAFDRRSGAIRWAFPPLVDPFPGIFTAPVVDYRALVRAGRRIVAGSTTGTVVAYDIDSRTEAWRFNGAWLGSTSFAFSADESTVYLPFFGGFFVAVDGRTGRELWRYGDSAQGFFWPPDPAGTHVYAGAGLTGFFAIARRPQEPVP